MRNRQLGSRNRVVVEADGPLAAAIQGYLAWSGSLPESVEVDPLSALDGGARSVAVTVVSTEGTRFRLHVFPETATQPDQEID